MVNLRKRVKHTMSFEERLAEEAKNFREAAEREPPGSMSRELLVRRTRQAETASHINDWLRSPGLKAPGQDSDEGYLAAIEKLRREAAETALIRDLAPHKDKRETFHRLHEHFNRLADEVEQA